MSVCMTQWDCERCGLSGIVKYEDNADVMSVVYEIEKAHNQMAKERGKSCTYSHNAVKVRLLDSETVKKIESAQASMVDVDKLYDNMTLFGCKYCLFQRKEMVIDVTMFSSLDKLLEHMEKDHDIVIPRPGEKQLEALERISLVNKRINTEHCLCPQCLYHLTDNEITEKLLEDGRVILQNGTVYIKQINQPMYDFVVPRGKKDGR
jgi:hypothetical protein